jgi:hypothetical protein
VLAERLGVRGRPPLHADVVRLVLVGALGVGRPDRHDDLLPCAEDLVASVELQPHRTGDDLDVLRVELVHVRAGEEAAGAADHVELRVLAARVRPRAPDLEPDSGLGHLQDIAGCYHRPILSHSADSSATPS